MTFQVFHDLYEPCARLLKDDAVQGCVLTSHEQGDRPDKCNWKFMWKNSFSC